MSDLQLNSTEPLSLYVHHIPRGTDPDQPGLECWYIGANYDWAQTIIATCDYAHHARAVSSALAIAHGIPVYGDVPAPTPPARHPGPRPVPSRTLSPRR